MGSKNKNGLRVCENICVETLIQKLFNQPQYNCNITKFVKREIMFVDDRIILNSVHCTLYTDQIQVDNVKTT